MNGYLKALTLALLFIPLSSYSRGIPKARDLRTMCDSLHSRLYRRMLVDNTISLTKIKERGDSVDLYFSAGLSYYPWRDGDAGWLREQIGICLKQAGSDLKPARIFTNSYALEDLTVPELGRDGSAKPYAYAIDKPSTKTLVSRVGARRAPLGLDGRYIALWQSHGRYFDEEQGVWMWQRPCMHRTVEDMFTQSFVLPFLMPMLENAGAYVLSPRERDIQRREFIIDNDEAFEGPRNGLIRRTGKYDEDGPWKDAGKGFADTKRQYTFTDNPFRNGSARQSECRAETDASVRWTPKIEVRGEYAVYVSYKTLPNSSEAAHYTVSHLGGKTDFLVNQRRGGGTWIYLGTFEFGRGSDGCVTLDNAGKDGTVVTADAVKIGGGMGKLERGGSLSGFASSVEGAQYSMQWAGADSTITRRWDTDYTNDFASRGLWTAMMREQKDIPIDLSLAFHTDAGETLNDSIVGTLAIYTLRADGEREFSDGRDRIISRLLGDYVQSQIVDDLRADFNPQWTRRGLADRSYSECRTTGVPGIILELLSHQNGADMRFGLDPSFRFTTCRAVYKGILKTLGEYYGCSYAVQPLPVHGFSAVLTQDDKISLTWEATDDPLEPTAKSDGYMVYTRIDDGAFDEGKAVGANSLELNIEKGHIYSFKVAAFNEGGLSFPSEILAAGVPEASLRPAVLVVNNFDRVSAPAWMESQSYAGFDSRTDSGVPYLRDINYIGENFDFDRRDVFVDNDAPGFGASYDSYAGEVVAGNTFDFPFIHGKALLALGYPFYSMSASAFCDSEVEAATIDLICGKQGRTSVGTGRVPDRYEVFPPVLRKALKRAAEAGCNLIVSGSNIASDDRDDEAKTSFTQDLLGFKIASTNGTDTGLIEDMPFSDKINPEIYCIEGPDGLKPAAQSSSIILRYPNSRFGAGILYKADCYSAVSIGIPIETVKSSEDRAKLLGIVMESLYGHSDPVDHR